MRPACRPAQASPCRRRAAPRPGLRAGPAPAPRLREIGRALRPGPGPEGRYCPGREPAPARPRSARLAIDRVCAPPRAGRLPARRRRRRGCCGGTLRSRALRSSPKSRCKRRRRPAARRQRPRASRRGSRNAPPPSAAASSGRNACSRRLPGDRTSRSAPTAPWRCQAQSTCRIAWPGNCDDQASPSPSAVSPKRASIAA